PHDVKEPALAAGRAEALGDGVPGGATRDQLAHVDDRDVRKVTPSFHWAFSFDVSSGPPAGGSPGHDATRSLPDLTHSNGSSPHRPTASECPSLPAGCPGIRKTRWPVNGENARMTH